MPELVCRKAAKLPPVQLLYGIIEVPKSPEPLRRDARLDDPAVFYLPRTRDKSPGLHAVEQARDVGIVRDEPAADLAACQAALARASQDAQNVVLRSRKAMGLEDDFGATLQGIGRAHQADEDLGLRAGCLLAGPLHGFAFLGHAGIIVVVTTNVKRNVGVSDVFRGGTGVPRETPALRLLRRPQVHFADEASRRLRHQGGDRVRHVVRLQHF